MQEQILSCPRYLAKSEKELSDVAQLWYRVGWRKKIVSSDEIRCLGCSSHKQCTYHLVECIKENKVKKCNECNQFPCEKIVQMLKQTKKYEEKCKKICSEKEYAILKKAFFNKESNLKK